MQYTSCISIYDDSTFQTSTKQIPLTNKLIIGANDSNELSIVEKAHVTIQIQSKQYYAINNSEFGMYLRAKPSTWSRLPSNQIIIGQTKGTFTQSGDHYILQLVHLCNGQRNEFPIFDNKEYTLGKSATQCNISLTNDNTISSVHMKIKMTNSGIQLYDCNSRNGLYMRHEKIMLSSLSIEPVYMRIGLYTFLKCYRKEEQQISLNESGNRSSLLYKYMYLFE